MTDPTTFRLDTIDLAFKFGWEVESILRMDEFSREGVAITVQYSTGDDIESIARQRPNRAEEFFPQDSAGKNDRLRAWLTGSAYAVVQPLSQSAEARVAGHWTRDGFIQAVEDVNDRNFLLRVLEFVDANAELPPKGTNVRLWFGKRPRGAVIVHPFCYYNPPFKFTVKDGRLMISGCWNKFPQVKGHSGFADLAAMLDLDESGPETAVSVAGLDPDKLWAVGENVSRAINA